MLRVLAPLLLLAPALTLQLNQLEQLDPVPRPRRPPPGFEDAKELGNEGITPTAPRSGDDLDSNSGEGEDSGGSVKATATVWVQANSRSWIGCSAAASEASKLLWSFNEQVNTFREGHYWEDQVGKCPNSPEVLTMAVNIELMRRFDLPEGLDETSDMSALEADIVGSRHRALEWVERAEAELLRRRDLRAFGLEYWRGRALLELGDYPGARAALDRALSEGAVEGWKLRRLLALTALYAGDLDQALEFASRAMLDAPSNDRVASLYVLSLALDRAGDPAGARRRMTAALNADNDRGVMRTLASAMPLHERLYLRAFAKTVQREQSGALRLWAAYLVRTEPEDPERRLAERHADALQPRPTSLGGPARAGEAPPDRP